ncbi:hypothetical protein GCM10010106_10770 [Thermopolyspora flexuosa]|nr:hypothetical protein GCM10010106_10770 [Thermopolyspora flexuosa]
MPDARAVTGGAAWYCPAHSGGVSLPFLPDFQITSARAGLLHFDVTVALAHLSP